MKCKKLDNYINTIKNAFYNDIENLKSQGLTDHEIGLKLSTTIFKGIGKEILNNFEIQEMFKNNDVENLKKLYIESPASEKIIVDILEGTLTILFDPFDAWDSIEFNNITDLKKYLASLKRNCTLILNYEFIHYNYTNNSMIHTNLYI